MQPKLPRTVPGNIAHRQCGGSAGQRDHVKPATTCALLVRCGQTARREPDLGMNRQASREQITLQRQHTMLGGLALASRQAGPGPSILPLPDLPGAVKPGDNHTADGTVRVIRRDRQNEVRTREFRQENRGILEECQHALRLARVIQLRPFIPSGGVGSPVRPPRLLAGLPCHRVYAPKTSSGPPEQSAYPASRLPT